MDLLEGIGQVFGEVFGSIFPDGILRKLTLTDNGKGGYNSTPDDHPIKVLVETVTDLMRLESDYNDKDAALIILRSGVDVDLTIEDKVFADSQWWSVKTPITADPAKAAWIARGSPTSG